MTSTSTSDSTGTATGSLTPTARVLTGALVVGPLLSLVADSLYAARGWDDGAAGAVHVLGAIAYGVVVLWVAARLPPASRLAALILLVGLLGMAGNVAYGFDAIHASYGDTPLVHEPGVANLIKPLGLLFPVSLALIALAIARIGSRRQAVLVLLAAIVWPIAHIGNIAPLAVAVNVVLVVAFGTLAWPRGRRP